MLVALVGAPNKGKSTLFNALTHANAQVADYPFTTIDPNKGVAFVTSPCPHVELGVSCKPRHGSCENGLRKIPVNVIDVAGLVPGASEGKGRGNEFLNDLSAADALVCVVDASGKTDEQGNPAVEGYDIANDYSFIQSELDAWMAKVIEKNAVKARGKKLADFAQYLSGLGVPSQTIIDEVKKEGLSENPMNWKSDQVAKALALRLRKPLAIAANKMDLPNAQANLEKLTSASDGKKIYPISADVELALSKAREKGLVDYDGSKVTPKIENAPPALSNAIAKLTQFVEKHEGSGVQKMLNGVVFELLDCMVVYPVEDEKRFSDHYGNALPDAILLPKNSTPVDLAAKIHTDLAKGFLHAVNAKTKMRIGKDEKLKNGDCIKIVSSN